jgi:hypothetical protein
MSTDDYKKDLFVNDEDRKLWESISNDAAEILHLKVRLLRECMSSSPPPEDGSTQSSSAARKERLPRKSPQDAPIYPLLAQKIKKAYRVNRKQQKLVEQAKAELAERSKHKNPRCFSSASCRS